MGCGISKLEDETAIAHCQTRCKLLLNSIQNRYALSEAHGEYAQALHSLSSSLHAFLLNSLPSSSRFSQIPVSSNRDLPSGRSTNIKFDSGRSTNIKLGSARSTNIKFDSARSISSRFEQADVIINRTKQKDDVTINRSKHHAVPPSISLEKSQAKTQNSGFAPYPYPPHMDYRMPLPSISSFFNFSNNNYNNNYNNQRFMSSKLPAEEPVLPPTTGPSLPENSAWDFLDPFGSYDKYYESYSYVPNSSFRRVREAEGIPDLEEVNDEEDDPSRTASASASKRVSFEKEVDKKLKSVKASASNMSERSFRSSFERKVQAKEKKDEENEGKEEKEEEVVVEVEPARVYRNDTEIVLEVKNQFERAAQAAEQVSGLLEVGKRRYSFKNSIRKVVGWMFCGLSSPPNSIDDEFSFYEQYRALDNGSLSITLQKLYMWERKLLEEVQNEEKLRKEYERKCRELNNFDERGADREKAEEMQRNLRKVCTKIRITLQVLGSISKKIHEIRDEELWPQICELVEGLLKMWEVMLESHQVQLNTISQAEYIFSTSAKSSGIHFETTKRLQLDLVTWATSFSIWVNAQRNYVKSLNGWLKAGLNHEPELTEDGPAPFSPSRLGLPPIFIILNNWFELMEKHISETGLIEAIQSFAINVSNLREKQKYEQHQMLMVNKDLKEIRIMEMEEKSLRRKLESYNKKLASLSRQNYLNLPATEMQMGENSLKSNLSRVFEASELFAFTIRRAYEELHMLCNEDD